MFGFLLVHCLIYHVYSSLSLPSSLSLATAEKERGSLHMHKGFSNIDTLEHCPHTGERSHIHKVVSQRETLQTFPTHRREEAHPCTKSLLPQFGVNKGRKQMGICICGCWKLVPLQIWFGWYGKEGLRFGCFGLHLDPL